MPRAIKKGFTDKRTENERTVYIKAGNFKAFLLLRKL